MRTDQIRCQQDQVSLLLGPDELLLPEPVGQLVIRYVTELHSNTLHDESATSWLFPGMLAGAPITQERLRRRLVRQLGDLPIRRSRNSAVTTLLRDVPAPVLADLLGFSQDRAHLWAQLDASNYGN